MSAPNRYARRGAVLGTIFASLFGASCRIGPNPSLSPAATSPHGIFVTAEWERGAPIPDAIGELIGSDERGVFVLHRNALALYPFGAPLVLRPDLRAPEPLDLRTDDEASIEEFMHYARHPFGVDERVVRSVLDAAGFEDVVTRRRP